MMDFFTVSAPGSLMLLGEHAVLHGYPCLVMAINRRVKVSVAPRNDGLVHVASSLGRYEGDREDLPDHPSFRFVISALRHLPDAFPGGLDAAIEADMPPTLGFGTSAAVTVAMTGALHYGMTGDLPASRILRDARSVIQKVQGRGSGADAAASTCGGVVHYRMDDHAVAAASRATFPVAALYCGYKTPTPEVIARVETLWRDRPEQLARLYRAIGDTVAEGRTCLSDAAAFGSCLNKGQRLMGELGVSTPELDACVEVLLRQPGISGSKISGSGMGDCAIGWGTVQPLPTHGGSAPDWPGNSQCFQLASAAEGIRLE